MNYIIDFEVAALMMQVLLIVMYHVRHNEINETDKAFANLLYLVLICTIADIISVFTLADIESIPLWINYFINILYLFTCNISSIAVFCYLTRVIGSKKLIRFGKGIASILIGIISILIIPTPWTGLIISLKNNEYIHGPGMLILYAISVSLLAMIFFILIFHRKDMNTLQFGVMIAMNGITISSIIIQAFINNLLFQNFAITLAYYMLYISLQNPDDYLDKFTSCRNRKFFYRIMEERMDKKVSLVGFVIEDFIQTQSMLGYDDTVKLLNNISIFLMKKYGKTKVYHINDGRYLLLLEKNDIQNSEIIIREIDTYFQNPILFDGLDWKLDPHFFEMKEQKISLDEMKEILESVYFQLETNKFIEKISIDEEYIHSLRNEKNLVRQLKKAVSEKRFEVYYQPIYNIKENRFHSAEALIRFIDENGQMVSPDYFIPIAENNGMILDIGEIVLDKVCRFLSEERTADCFDYIEINLSMVQCVHESLPSMVLNYAEKYQIDPKRLNFEITETAEIASEDILMHNMTHLCQQGFSFSLDDFGTGFSTASYLTQMPVEIVKIDKSILWSAMENEQSMSLLGSIISMIQQLKKKIVVEGIESEQMADILRKLGCDYLQGFFYSKPLPEKELIMFLQSEYC